MNMEKEDSNNLKALRNSVDQILEIMLRPKKVLAKILEGCSGCRYFKCFRHYWYNKTMVWRL